LITGEAKYIDDIQLPGMLNAGILRSPYAHARIKSINTQKAATLPGVAVVIAEDRYTVEHALGMVDLDYKPLQAVVDVEKAAQHDAPQLQENAPNNICMDWICEDLMVTDQALADTNVVVRQHLVNQRFIPNLMEPRSTVAPSARVALPGQGWSLGLWESANVRSRLRSNAPACDACPYH
jgi:carbon-monoxide dehydrogenase large subunit